MADTMKGELAEGQRQLLALAAAGGGSGAEPEAAADPVPELVALLRDRR